MFACVDVGYHDLGARAAAVTFERWEDADASGEYSLEIAEVEPYVPGQFYKRELPCVLAVLEQFTKSPEGQANEVFGRRLRLGHPIEVRHEHNWHRIMPPDRYGKEHPEWFAEINGERYPKHYAEKRGGQVCTSNLQVVEHFARVAIEHFNKDPKSDMFSIAANDGRKFCTCKSCLALDSGQTRPDGRRVTTDRIITFSNQVAERVAKVHPDKRLGVIIYLDYKYPPKNVKPHPMLFLVHPTNSGFSQGAYYEGDQWSEAAMERGWHEAAGTFYKYDIWHYDQTPLLVRLIDHHNYTMHTVASMIFVGRTLTGTANSDDRKAFEQSLAKRDAAKDRIAKYRPFYAKLIADLDTNSHTGVLYGKKPTIEVRAPSDFNQ